jgi:hypothetical protein
MHATAYVAINSIELATERSLIKLFYYLLLLLYNSFKLIKHCIVWRHVIPGDYKNSARNA